MIENNEVCLVGKFISSSIFNHEIHGKKYYIVYLEVPRISENVDIIPIMVSERFLDRIFLERIVQVTGSIRTYNKCEENKTRLIISVFANDIADSEESQTNNVFLDGYVCKNVTYRETPLGRRISDIHIAVNRPYLKSDYIPCIAWGKGAQYASRLNIGDRIKVNGRIQSREYVKKVSETEYEKRIAYEVSVANFEKVNYEN